MLVTPISSNGDIGLGGGTQGVTRGTATPSLLDFPVAAPGFAGTPAGSIPGAGGPVTAGLRSGDLAISQNTIDSLIANASGGAAAGSAQRLGPATLSIAGVLTTPQFQAVMRTVEQKS